MPPLALVLVVLIVLLAIGVVPHWGYSRDWGYGPSGTLGAVVVILIVLIVLGKL